VGGGAPNSPAPPGPNDPQNFPVAAWSEHAREVFSVSWNLIRKDVFSSSSWDGTVKIWDPNRPASQVTLPTHSCTYSAQWSPHNADVISSVSSDSHLRIFDLRTPASAANHLVLSVPLHSAPAPKGGSPAAFSVGASPPAEALTHDWNKYRDSIVAAAGVDRAVRTFDIRAPQQGPLAILSGHQYAVRKVTWSPHLPDLLLSASYDMTCRVWTDGSAVGVNKTPEGPVGETAFGGGWEMGRMGRHTEFVTGVDWCLFGAEGWCASCGWDERVLVWDVRAIMGP
jgi:peroxin-7